MEIDLPPYHSSPQCEGVSPQALVAILDQLNVSLTEVVEFGAIHAADATTVLATFEDLPEMPDHDAELAQIRDLCEGPSPAGQFQAAGLTMRARGLAVMQREEQTPDICCPADRWTGTISMIMAMGAATSILIGMAQLSGLPQAVHLFLGQ